MTTPWPSREVNPAPRLSGSESRLGTHPVGLAPMEPNRFSPQGGW